MESLRARQHQSYSRAQERNSPANLRSPLEVECEMLEGQLQQLVRQKHELLLRQAAEQKQKNSQDQEIRKRVREMMKQEILLK